MLMLVKENIIFTKVKRNIRQEVIRVLAKHTQINPNFKHATWSWRIIGLMIV
jgi:hypothetical protein